MTLSQALRHVRKIQPCGNPHPAHMISPLEILKSDGKARLSSAGR